MVLDLLRIVMPVDSAMRGSKARIVSQSFSLSEDKWKLAFFHDILERLSFLKICDLGSAIEISRFIVQLSCQYLHYRQHTVTLRSHKFYGNFVSKFVTIRNSTEIEYTISVYSAYLGPYHNVNKLL